MQPENADPFMTETEFGIKTVVKFRHSKNDASLNVVTELGMLYELFVLAAGN